MRYALFSATLLASSIASAAVPVDGWYIGGFGGYTYLPSNITVNVGGFKFSNPSYRAGYNAGARIGYQSNPLRYELEYTYLYAPAKSFKLNHTQLRRVNGNSSANLGMANIYFDFPDVLIPAISPFLGVGIGYGYLKANLNSKGPFGFISFTDTASSFAYQGTAGLTFNFSENFAFNASYRYVATSSSSFGQTYQAQLGNGGVVYRFDQCDYK